MKKMIWVFIMSLWLSASIYAADIPVASTVRDVTVYPNAALIQRSANVTLDKGVHRIIINDIVAQLDENSLSVSGAGSAKVKIYGAQIKKEFLREPADARVKELEDKIQAINDHIKAENNNLGLLAKEESFLESIKLFAGQQIPKDLVTQMPSVEDLAGVAGFLKTNLKTVAESREKVNIVLRGLSEERDALIRELNQIRGAAQKMQRSVVVDVECDQPGKLDLVLSFFVYGVQWYPVYDARVSFDEKKVELTSFAMIKQTTGEDWTDVALTISTARPSVSGQMPELYPWHLNPAPPVYERKGAVGGVRAAQMLMKADAPMANEMDFADEQQEQAQMIFAEAQTAGANVVYKISKPATIKSDGTEHRIGVTAQVLPAQFRYASTPKLSPYAYLKTKVANQAEGQLLPGMVHVFLDGSYVGKSQIEKVLGSKEEFDLYLGVDESVTVKRELLEKKTDDTFIGGIPSPNKTIVSKYKLTVENYKTKSISLSLFDQVPVSQNDKIRIKNVQFRPDPADKNYQDRQGVARWVLELAPQEKKEVEFSFTVEHPRDLVVHGL
jgi:uncharacterized protein (TIGR02231 family)